MKYVKKHYLSKGKNCTVKVVFDSYPSVPTSKDSAHIRRGKSKSTNISIASNTILDLTKSLFLSNQRNKQRFVDFVIPYLKKVHGIACVQAVDDADTLIAKTAIQHLKTTDVTLYGDDTDLLALLLHQSNDILATNRKLCMQIA